MTSNGKSRILLKKSLSGVAGPMYIMLYGKCQLKNGHFVLSVLLNTVEIPVNGYLYGEPER